MTQPAHKTPQRRALAGNPATLPEVLATLAADASLHVRQEAARNPSTPPRVLTLLQRAGATADMAGFAPPDSTLSAEELSEAAQLGEWGRRLAVRHPAASAVLLAGLANDAVESVRRDAARHPNTPADVLRRLATEVSDEVRNAARRHPAASRSWIDVLEAAEQGEPVETSLLCELSEAGAWGRCVAARHPLTPRDMLVRLAVDNDWRVRAALAFNPATPAELLEKLDALDDVNTHVALAQHPNASHDLLQRMLGDDVRIRAALAHHPDPPHTVLLALALDGRVMVQEMAANHPKMPRSIVEQLGRLGIASDLMHFVDPDPTLEPEVIESLARHGLGRQLAARHPATPRRLLAFLATDADPVVRMTAAKHPNLPSDLLPLLVQAGSSEDLQGFVAPLPGVHPEQLQLLANLGPWARRLAARHPNLPVGLFMRLLQCDDVQVNRELARHPSAPAEVLTLFAASESIEVRWAVAQRAVLSAEASTILAQDATATIRAAMAHHPSTPADVLTRLCDDLDEDVRAAARAQAGGVVEEA